MDGETPAHLAPVSVAPLADPLRIASRRPTDAHALLVVPAHDLGPVNVPDHDVTALRANGQVRSLADVGVQARALVAGERRATLRAIGRDRPRTRCIQLTDETISCSWHSSVTYGGQGPPAANGHRGLVWRHQLCAPQTDRRHTLLVLAFHR